MEIRKIKTFEDAEDISIICREKYKNVKVFFDKCDFSYTCIANNEKGEN